MELLGATRRAASRPARGRSRRPTSEAIRDWVTNVADTHYVIGSAVGPAPYPAIVRDLQRVIGDEARAQLLERDGPAAGPRRSPASAAARTRSACSPLRRRRGRRAVGVEAAGEGLETGRHGAPLTVGGRPGVLHGALLGGPAGRRGPDPRGALDLGRASTTRAPGPSTRGCATRGRARYVAVTDDEALAAFRERRAARGDHPGARDRARARTTCCASRPRRELDLVCLRAAATRTSPRCWRRLRRRG